MSDTKRILVWLFVLVWCVLSLCIDVRAQELAPIPEFTEQRCSEPVEVAANTIIIKKKAVSVPAAGGGFTPTWVWATGTIPTSGDPNENLTPDYHDGVYVTAPVGATKITKLRAYYLDSNTASAVWLCVYLSTDSEPLTALGGGAGSLPGTDTGFYAVDTGTLNISITAGLVYWIQASNAETVKIYYRTGVGNGHYTEDNYSGSCGSSAEPITNTNFIDAMGVYFE